MKFYYHNGVGRFHVIIWKSLYCIYIISVTVKFRFENNITCCQQVADNISSFDEDNDELWYEIVWSSTESDFIGPFQSGELVEVKENM